MSVQDPASVLVHDRQVDGIQILWRRESKIRLLDALVRPRSRMCDGNFTPIAQLLPSRGLKNVDISTPEALAPVDGTNPLSDHLTSSSLTLRLFALGAILHILQVRIIEVFAKLSRSVQAYLRNPTYHGSRFSR